MRKSIILAAACIAAVVSCTKTAETVSPQGLISFMPANQINTKVTGTVFPTTETFGTYAWTANTAGEYFIENKEVSFDGTKWTTSTPYYWPKNQSVDFFSYYPYNATGAIPVVTKTKITYNNVDFSATQLDIMYADKAVAFTDNANQVEDGQNAYEGVPTIFRHAGCKVKINVILGENEKTEGDNTVTKWDVSLKSTTLSGLYVQGSCELNLADSPTTGLVPWVKPAGNVWAANTAITNSVDNSLYTDVVVHNLVKNEGVTVIPETYMLPQTLAAGQQKITLLFDVTTYRKAPGAADFVLALTQNDVAVSADLIIDTTDLNAITAWEMNHNIVYNITIGPAGKQITFDPAIDNWVNKTVATNIELQI